MCQAIDMLLICIFLHFLNLPPSPEFTFIYWSFDPKSPGKWPEGVGS